MYCHSKWLHIVLQIVLKVQPLVIENGAGNYCPSLCSGPDYSTHKALAFVLICKVTVNWDLLCPF